MAQTAKWGEVEEGGCPSTDLFCSGDLGSTLVSQAAVVQAGIKLENILTFLVLISE